MLPKVSVIVAVYNVQEYLPQCIESLAAQTYGNLEIFLVDDGSTDASGRLCDEWAARDGRFIAVHRPNGGLSAARNTGLEKASGEYVAFVDGDDRIDSEMYSHMVQTATEFSADAVLGEIRAVEPGGRQFNPFENSFGERQVVDRYEIMRLLASEKQISTSACNKLFRRSLFDGICFPEGKVYEDKAVMHELMHRCEIISVDKRAVYYYLLHNNSITKMAFTEKNFDQLDAARIRYDFYKQHYPELAEEVRANLCEQAIIQTIIALKGHASKEQFLRLIRWVAAGRPAYCASRSIPWSRKVPMWLKYRLTCMLAVLYLK